MPRISATLKDHCSLEGLQAILVSTIADDRATLGDDVDNKPDHEDFAATFIPGNSITNEPVTASAETANAAETPDLLEPAKFDSAGLPVPDQAQSISHTTASQLPSHDTEFTEGQKS